ncbi:MAG: bifunctional UDP-sugar hydrolase/5'-nucleotidase [Bacilli bacterium]
MVSSSSELKHVLDKDLAILYTNDTHCALGDKDNLGYANLSQYRKDLLTEDKYVTLVDCGDAIQGDSIGTLSNGAYIHSIMENVGYDIAIPGNHEFDYGMTNFLSLANNSSFKYVSCNFTDLLTNSLVFKPYTIKQYGTIKIAYLGITTPKTITTSTPTYFQNDKGNFIYGFDQGDGSQLYAAVQKYVDEARSEGADYVIGLSHLGTTSDCSPYESTEVIKNTTGIDVMLDCHSHSVIECDRVKNKNGDRVLLSSTGTKFQSFGMLYMNKEGSFSTGLIKEYYGYDTTIGSYIDSINSLLDEKLKEKVGTSAYDLTILNPDTGKREVRNGDTNLGDFSADAFRVAGDSDIAIVNAGGIRDNIKAGDITYGGIIKVMPFNNMLAKVEATGQKILDALELSVYNSPSEFGDFLQVSGLSFEYDLSVPTPVVLDKNDILSSISGERRVKKVLINGVAIDASKKYTVCSTNYILKNSGNGYNMFKDCPFLMDENQLDNQALINYIKTTLSGTIPETYSNPLGSNRIKALNA